MPYTVQRALRYALAAVLAAASFILVNNSVQGAGPSRSIVNLQSLAATLVIVSIALSHRNGGLAAPRTADKSVGFCILLVALPFLVTLKSPFLFDSYSHIVSVSEETLPLALRAFYQHPVDGDFFFRPLGHLDYWLESRWAGFSPSIWRCNGISLHIAASFCVFLLSRKLSLSAGASLFAALLFALHGSNPEVVSWTAARFDELATCLSIITLILVCSYVDTGRRFFLMLLVAASAMLSKESAVCLPALAVCILTYRGRLDRRSVKALIGLTSSTLIVLVYRFWVLGGVGGYRNASGQSTALQFSFLHSAELFLFRMWSVLLLPINWSVRNEWWLSLSLALALLGLGVICIAGRAVRRKSCSALSFCAIALLPASHLALLDSTLLGSRVYHLSLIGSALLLAAVYDGFASRPFGWFIAGCFVVFNSAALCHNLLIWRDTAQLAGQVCRTFSIPLRQNETVVVENLPKQHNGVYFLANAFSECVFVNSGKRITVLPSDTGTGPIFRWDDASKSLLPVKVASIK